MSLREADGEMDEKIRMRRDGPRTMLVTDTEFAETVRAGNVWERRAVQAYSALFASLVVLLALSIITDGGLVAYAVPLPLLILTVLVYVTIQAWRQHHGRTRSLPRTKCLAWSVDPLRRSWDTPAWSTYRKALEHLVDHDVTDLVDDLRALETHAIRMERLYRSVDDFSPGAEIQAQIEAAEAPLAPSVERVQQAIAVVLGATMRTEQERADARRARQQRLAEAILTGEDLDVDPNPGLTRIKND